MLSFKTLIIVSGVCANLFKSVLNWSVTWSSAWLSLSKLSIFFCFRWPPPVCLTYETHTFVCEIWHCPFSWTLHGKVDIPIFLSATSSGWNLRIWRSNVHRCRKRFIALWARVIDRRVQCIVNGGHVGCKELPFYFRLEWSGQIRIQQLFSLIFLLSVSSVNDSLYISLPTLTCLQWISPWCWWFRFGAFQQKGLISK